MMTILSLGAGVQSSTMALLAARGKITPTPDAAIFADTGWEPRAVYDYLEYLVGLLPFPVYRVTAGNIRDDVSRGINSTGGSFAAVPFHLQMPGGAKGFGRRQCTSEYKIRPIQKKIVELCHGKRSKGQVSLWMGISTDEASRMKPSRVQYIVHRWPLIELEMSRGACLRWLEEEGVQRPPKSSCLGCPFHSDRQWREIRDGNPAEWDDVVRFDREIRDQKGIKGKQYLHRSLKPLNEVDLSTAEERGQINMFENECEGMCGV
jgi:hypothetical protein